MTEREPTKPFAVTDLLAPEGGLNCRGEWLRVQLRVAQYWADKQSRSDSEASSTSDEHGAAALPARWQGTRGIELFEWQRECAQRWLHNEHRGIAKVVTGAGKTVFAQHLIERLQTEVDPELRVAVVVPTIVLMRQWIESLTAHANLPRQSIGALGGGSKDSFSESTRILVCVLNSAAGLLAPRVQKAGVGPHLLLVVDECHRATGRSMSRVFETPRRYNLGLSATPEREDAAETAGEHEMSAGPDQLETVITDKLGPVVYELRPDDAIRQGILSTFEFRHYGLPLDANERVAYEKLSRDIRELAKTLRAAAVRSRGGSTSSLARLAQSYARRAGSALSAEASQYLTSIRRRKNLLYRAQVRTRAVMDIVSETLAQSPDSKILVFHESIAEVMRLYEAILRAGHRVTVDHSELPGSVRADSISLFRSGAANILISARTLIEGFDVPSADIGIIAAASSSVRQRVQTIGRLLRRPKDGGDKRAVIHTLYMAATVDEVIYEKTDWSSITGAERDLYFRWMPPEPETPADERGLPAFLPEKQEGPPRLPKPPETEIDWSQLAPGDLYPGKFEGTEYRCDQQGNVLDVAGRVVTNPQDVPDRVAVACGKAVRFKVTPVRRAILCWDRQSRSVRFAGFLDAPFRIGSAAPVKAGRRNPAGGGEQAVQYKLQQFRGQRRVKNYAGKVALPPELAADPERGQDATRVITGVEELEKRLGTTIYQFMIEGDEAYCIINGERHPICRLSKGLEFK